MLNLFFYLPLHVPLSLFKDISLKAYKFSFTINILLSWFPSCNNAKMMQLAANCMQRSLLFATPVRELNSMKKITAKFMIKKTFCGHLITNNF